MQEWAQNHGLVGYSVAAALEDGTATTWVGGQRDVARNLPVQTSTVFRVASISKAAVALGFFQLWADGELGLDDDINNALEGLLPPIQHPDHPDLPLTPRMLLCHTSGLRDGSGYGDFLTATYQANSGADLPHISELLMPAGAYHTPDMWSTAPGESFAYANVNFGLLGTVLEAVAGERFDVWMTSHVFEPLGLNASFSVHDLEDIDDVAVLYRYVDGWVAQADQYEGTLPPLVNLDQYVPGTNALRFAPQGGLRCSAVDLLDLISEWTMRADGSSPSALLPAPAVAEMRSEAWAFDGSNGDSYGGLFERWSLGLHLDDFQANSFPVAGNQAKSWGHPGEAYGLISGAYHVTSDDGCRFRFAYLINGMNPSPNLGSDGWYTVENELHEMIGQWANSACSTSLQNEFSGSEGNSYESVALSPGAPLPPLMQLPNVTWIDASGKPAREFSLPALEVPALPTGKYVLTQNGMPRGSVFVLPPTP